MGDELDHCPITNINVSLRKNVTARVYTVVFISFNGDVRFVSLKTASAAGVSHPIIENLRLV
jgi:hypothetical protein